MAPNILLRQPFPLGECSSVNDKSVDPEIIRTDFMLQNAFSHLIKDSYTFKAIPAKHSSETNVLREFIKVVDDFKLKYFRQIQNLCADVQVTADTVDIALSGVSNELFYEGITWSKIVGLFVFVGEITVQCLSRGMDPGIVDEIYKSFVVLVKKNLEKWIDDHDGWAGIQSAYLPKERNSSMDKAEDKGWRKILLHSTLRMIGTLAHIANSTGQTFP